jgi:hypothetical protein
MWGVFTTLLAAGAYFINLPAFLAFVLLAIPYFLLGFASILGDASPADALTRIGGWTLVADGAVAWYLAWASAMNSLIGERLPLWPYPYAHEAEVVPPAPAVPATRSRFVPSDRLDGVDRDACLPIGAGAPVTSGNCPPRTSRGRALRPARGAAVAAVPPGAFWG